MIKVSLGIVILAACINTPAAAQEQPENDVKTVVITGTPITELQAQLRNCIAAKCPPKQDIDASLSLAEGQFLAGDYAGARQTLGKSRGRNNRYAKTLPEDVGDLNRAYGRIANFDGRPDRSHLAQITALDALKAGLDKDDTRIFMQRVMVGDEYARAGRLHAAQDVYRKVERQARKAGKIRAAGYAMFREAVVYSAAASVWRGYRPSFEDRVERLERTHEPELAEFRYAAKILRANLLAFDRNPKALSEAVASIPPRSPEAPVLIYSPVIRADEVMTGNAVMTGDPTPSWLDIRFRIAADGTVHQVEVLRDSGNVDEVWPKQVLESVAGRRYAPLALPAGSAGPSRVERFSYVHDLVLRPASRLSARKLQGRITSLDLTVLPSR